MTLLALEKKIAPLLPRGKKTLERFMKDALLLQLQDVSKKIAVFEARYNKSFREFRRDWIKTKSPHRYSYQSESDSMDWEALETHKRDLMRVMHSL